MTNNETDKQPSLVPHRELRVEQKKKKKTHQRVVVPFMTSHGVGAHENWLAVFD